MKQWPFQYSHGLPGRIMRKYITILI